MMYQLKLLLYCVCLTALNVNLLKAEGSFEDADQVSEFITMSFSSSHPYDLRQTIPGEPEIDYPIFSAVPRTNFDCNGRHEGYYADTEARCQVFRICANTDLVGKGFAFLCPNGTLFSQKNFVCDWYRNVDCNDSERYYSKNDNNRIGSKTDLMKTVRQMMEHPMKTISMALNRVKVTTRQPTTLAFNPITRRPVTSTFQRSSPSPVSSFPKQPSFNIENKQQNIDPGAFEFSSPLQKVPTIGQTLLPPPLLEEGFKPVNVALTITPPSATFTPPFESPQTPPLEGSLPSENISYDTFFSGNQAQLQVSPNQDGTDDDQKEVYVSSLGELSTDPGANFNRQTSRVIADSPSNTLETSEIKNSKSNGLNFAEKVNAGLNGLQVISPDEVIAPEYVKNIMNQNNVGISSANVQPVSFDFASNINSLLDEVNYEAELEGQNFPPFQQLSAPTTRKPFRFLSRGFSHEKSKSDGSYVVGSTPAPRSSFRPVQHSARKSTKSYSNSLITTSITTTTPLPPTSTEENQVSDLETSSENPKTEPSVKLDQTSETPETLESNQSKTISENESSVPKSSTSEESISSTPLGIIMITESELELEQKLDSKPAIKREPKDLKQLDSDDSAKEQTQEISEDDKVNANKKAEDLLVAGVKQITVNEPVEKDKTDEEESKLPIVPIYNRAQATENSAPHITSSSTTSISTTTTSTTVPTTLASSTPYLITDSSMFTTIILSTTTEPTPTPPYSSQKFTVESAKRRPTLRPISYSRRNNLQRSSPRTTSTTTKPPTSPTKTFRGRPGRLTTTTAVPNPTKVTTVPRKRLNVNRYTFSSRRRTTESPTSSTSSTTEAPNSESINSQNSDSGLSDLSGAASTYNAVPNRSYNSIRQNSNKWVQTKRRRPSNKNVTSEITTTKVPSKVPKTQQRSSSSYPTSTLAPFSYHEVLTPIPISSTTPEPLPATYLSFNDLTKSITDDSILQNLKKTQAFNKQLVDSSVFKNQQQQALPRQPIPFLNQPRINQDYSTQKPPATSLPFIPLKDFIASKFGSQYSPEPPKLSTSRPSLITNQAVRLPTPVQYTIRTPSNQNVFNQQPHQIKQQQPQQQFQQQQHQLQHQQHHQQQQLYQEQQLRLQQQQQKLQLLKEQQNQLQHQYQLQQKLQQQKQQQHQLHIQQQKLQQHQVPQQQFLSNFQQQPQPSQQYSQLPQVIPSLEQAHHTSTKIIPSIEQQFHIQQSQQIQIPQQQQQQQQQSQIQIIPSQMAVSQTIHPQQQEVGSINVRLPSNLAGLIPNTNVFDLTRSSNSLDIAQRRSDQTYDDTFGARERKSAFAGVSSYDVPLSSVGRLANDITHLLRRL